MKRDDLIAVLVAHRSAGYNQAFKPGSKAKAYRCKCGVTYNADEREPHLADTILALSP